MADTSKMVTAYRDWILSYGIEGVSVQAGERGNVVLKGEGIDGWVNFYDMDGQTVVELRLEKVSDGSSLFFLHFELEDLDRARRQFAEMASVLERSLLQDPVRVLLCCTCGMTTTFFASKLNDLASEFDLGFDFSAKPIEGALEKDESFDVILLAPQVGHRLKEVQAALPGVMAIELPASVFGSYDAKGALRLLMEVVQQQRTVAKNDLRFAREFDHTKSVLGISYVVRYDEPTISYVVLDKGEERLRGMLVRAELDLDSIIDDLLEVLNDNGCPIDSLDAVGIAVPGVVYHGEALVQRSGDDIQVDVASYLSERLRLPVFVDNNATAAAAGCYVSQQEWDDLVFHAQPIGDLACDEGYVLDGRPRIGLNGFGGNMRYLADRFALSVDLRDASWRYDGMRELTACYLGSVICTIAPKAIFVWCDLLPDMSDLHDELARIVPEESIPELIPVADYDGLTLMGELALCLQRLVES